MYNENEFNNFFAPKSNLVAKQVATPEVLTQEKSRTDLQDQGSSGLLVQDTIAGNAYEINISDTPKTLIEKKRYNELYYCVSKHVYYFQLKKLGQYLPTGDIIQKIINAPNLSAIRSRTNTTEDLKKLHDMQYYLNTGPTGNSFLNEISEPLPGAVDQQEFIKRLDPAAAESEVLRSMARKGFVDTDFNPLLTETAQAEVPQTRQLTLRDTTPLEEVCKGRNA